MTEITDENKLVDKMSDFIKQSVLGPQLQIYDKMPLNILSDPNTLSNVAPLFQNQYYNYVYKALISKSDHFINDEFEEMKSYTNHGTFCLINILANTSFKISKELESEKINYESLDTYTESIEEQIDDLLDHCRHEIVDDLNHECIDKEVLETDKLQDIFFFQFG